MVGYNYSRRGDGVVVMMMYSCGDVGRNWCGDVGFDGRRRCCVVVWWCGGDCRLGRGSVARGWRGWRGVFEQRYGGLVRRSREVVGLGRGVGRDGGGRLDGGEDEVA